jgi:sarcosine oxidase subunit alpha
LNAGSHFIGVGAEAKTSNDQGWMSSVTYSPSLETSIGLGFIKSGDQRMGEKVRAIDLVNNKSVEVEITSPHFFDPEGGRLRV